MTELEKYEFVNMAESLDELANVIRKLAVDGVIQGRTRPFDAEKMAKNCESFAFSKFNTLTKEYGIRQQAIMLFYYN